MINFENQRNGQGSYYVTNLLSHTSTRSSWPDRMCPHFQATGTPHRRRLLVAVIRPVLQSLTQENSD